MTKWHGYIGLERLNLGTAKWQLLLAEIDALGPVHDPSPAKMNHARARLDGDARIYEANFNESALTVARFKERLAALYGVDPSEIGHSVAYKSYGDYSTVIVTFDYDSLDRLRFALFGDVDSSWPESGDECRGYLITFCLEWGDCE